MRTIDWRLELVMASGEVSPNTFLEQHICFFRAVYFSISTSIFTLQVGRLEEPLVVLQLGDGIGDMVVLSWQGNNNATLKYISNLQHCGVLIWSQFPRWKTWRWSLTQLSWTSWLRRERKSWIALTARGRNKHLRQNKFFLTSSNILFVSIFFGNMKQA